MCPVCWDGGCFCLDSEEGGAAWEGPKQWRGNCTATPSPLPPFPHKAFAPCMLIRHKRPLWCLQNLLSLQRYHHKRSVSAIYVIQNFLAQVLRI